MPPWSICLEQLRVSLAMAGKAIPIGLIAVSFFSFDCVTYIPSVYALFCINTLSILGPVLKRFVIFCFFHSHLDGIPDVSVDSWFSSFFLFFPGPPFLFCFVLWSVSQGPFFTWLCQTDRLGRRHPLDPNFSFSFLCLSFCVIDDGSDHQKIELGFSTHHQMVVLIMSLEPVFTQRPVGTCLCLMKPALLLVVSRIEIFCSCFPRRWEWRWSGGKRRVGDCARL